MELGENNVKYFLYLRKSSESEDRQMASIEAQKEEMTRFARENDLNIVGVFEESKSAKIPDNRTQFSEMLERLQTSEADGVLCWKLNRLARNATEGGRIIDLLGAGVIQRVQTYGPGYTPESNVIMMSVEFGMANQFVKDLSVDTKRGLRNKAERGWIPGAVPLGYTFNPLKRKGEKEVINDEQFPIVKRMWQMMLKGNTNPRKIHKVATEEWGLKGKNGKNISIANIYAMFHNPFYYGEFEYPRGSGKWYQGKHEPMVTKDDVETVQRILGDKGKPKPKTLEFTYRIPGFVCGECGCSITAEITTKRQKNGITRVYRYYRCTKKKLGIACSQKYLEEKEVERQLLKILSRIDLPESVVNWALKKIKAEAQTESVDRNKIIANLQMQYNKCVKTIDGLIDMRACGELSDEEYSQKKTSLLKEKEELMNSIKSTDHRVTRWVDEFEEKLEFAKLLSLRFKNARPEGKKEILLSLGSNLVLKDKKVSIELPDYLYGFEKLKNEALDVVARLEPQKTLEKQEDFDGLYDSCQTMLRGLDSNQ